MEFAQLSWSQTFVRVDLKDEVQSLFLTLKSYHEVHLVAVDLRL